MRRTVLDIPIDCITAREALEKVREFLKSKERFQITTPNPEFTLAAQRNQTFKKTLQESNLSIADGTGIVWAINLLHGVKTERVTGVDFMKLICSTFRKKGIFLLGASEEVNEKTKRALEKKYPGIRIVGNYSGTPGSHLEKIICQMINASKAQFLFVAYGAPNQDLWIARNLPHLHTVKVAMGVGGSFDFISGYKKRAPRWMRVFGLEWLFRLMQEPARYRRIFKAVIVFPLVVMRRKLARMFWLTRRA